MDYSYFNRWVSREHTSWPFSVFQKYSRELSHIYITHVSSQEFVYRNLGKVAKWEDATSKHFVFKDEIYERTFPNIKSWSDSYNELDNWINLNAIMAVSSNFETYLSKIIQLSLESDTGILFGVGKKIDGVEILKHSNLNKSNFENQIISCTKGDWNSRLNAFVKLFGYAPTILIDNISSLEKLRKLRNNVGHAFGREIEDTRKFDSIKGNEVLKLDREKTIKYMKLIFGISREIDKQLLVNHIGEYQTIFFYHQLRKSIDDKDPIYKRQLGNHTALLKKRIGRFGAITANRNFCKELIIYYDSL